MKDMRRWLSVLCVVAGIAQGAEKVAPSQFYVVSASFSDYGPAFYYRVIEVWPDGPNSHVRYSRISTVNAYCPRMVIRSAEATLHNVSPGKLTKASNPCVVKPGALGELLKKYSRRAALFEGASLGIVAQCDASSVVLGLPTAQELDMKRLRSGHPEIARLLDLSSKAFQAAFGPKDILLGPAEADDLVLQLAGARFAPELVSGKYDAGLAAAMSSYAGKAPSFRELLAGYRGPVSADEANMGYVPQLVDAEAYHFTQFTPPKYPPLGMQARIEGAVRLQLSVEPSTGEVFNVEALSGNRVLKPSAIEAARKWRFAPNSGVASTINLTLDYALRCR